MNNDNTIYVIMALVCALGIVLFVAVFDEEGGDLELVGHCVDSKWVQHNDYPTDELLDKWLKECKDSILGAKQ